MFSKKDGEVYISGRDLYHFFLKNTFFIHTSAISIRLGQYSIDDLLFDENLLYTEDTKKWCELVIGNNVALLKDVLSSYRDRDGSLVTDTLALDEAALKVYAMHLKSPLEPLSVDTQKACLSKLEKQYVDVIYGKIKLGEYKSSLKYSLGYLFKIPSYNSFRTVFITLIKCFRNTLSR
jgi:hypothetical protein